MYVVGTAGHVDHGKSRLVEALTGINPDRLPEERARGMTIDLGFAWLTLTDGKGPAQEISIVDVPGHENFIRNMLAGVGCIDAAILVVAANDGVMPQTREHLTILDLLQVHNGVIAVTKKDLVDRELLDLAIEEIRETVAGTALADAPIVPVSALTGEGLAELVDALRQVLAQTPLRPDLGRPRVWIDRVFSVTGFGTIVTGVLIDGVLRVGQEVVILPAGHTSRIRTLEVHKRRVEVAHPGARVALNVADLTVGEIERGDLLTVPGCLQPTRRVDARIICQAGTSEGLEDGVRARLFVGSMDTEVKIRLLDADLLAPGETGLAQLFLEEPVALARGDRFVLRRSAIKATVGGGVVISPHPLRHRRHSPSVIATLRGMEQESESEILKHALGDKPPAKISRLLEWTSLTPVEMRQAIASLLSAGEVILFSVDDATAISPNDYIVSSGGWKRLLDEITRYVGEYHRRYPLRPAMPKEDMRSRLDVDTDLFRQIVARAVEGGVLVEEGSGVRLVEHHIQLTPQQQKMAERLLNAYRQSPLTPPTAKIAAEEYGVDVELLHGLAALGHLVDVGDEVYFLPQVYEEMVAKVVAFLEEEGSILPGQARDLLGTTRRYIMPLLNHLDERQITRRDGEKRVLTRTYREHISIK